MPIGGDLETKTGMRWQFYTKYASQYAKSYSRSKIIREGRRNIPCDTFF
jgi:hypothetical protein